MASFFQSHAVAVVSSITGSIIAARQKFTVFILWLFLMFLRPVGSKRPEVERIIQFMGLRLKGELNKKHHCLEVGKFHDSGLIVLAKVCQVGISRGGAGREGAATSAVGNVDGVAAGNGFERNSEGKSVRRSA